jgi:hypothetical protein
MRGGAVKTSRIEVGKVPLSRGCYAKIAGWSAYGRTREEAHETLVRALRDQQEHMHTNVVLVGSKAVFTLRYADGWQYNIIHLDVVGRDTPGTTMLNTKSKQEAIDSMTRHYNQYHE